jgi:hypothetical protein
MASAGQYRLEQGRRPSFTNTDAIAAEPNGWYRNKGHRRRPGVVRGRPARTTDKRKHIVTSYNINTGPRLYPFHKLHDAYLDGHITPSELMTAADRYGALGVKVAVQH